jgi:hypothetical protein
MLRQNDVQSSSPAEPETAGKAMLDDRLGAVPQWPTASYRLKNSQRSPANPGTAGCFKRPNQNGSQRCFSENFM